MTQPKAIEKILSASDTGQTGGHQAGILVPKTGEVLSFFPRLDPHRKNPRVVLDVIDDADDVPRAVEGIHPPDGIAGDERVGTERLHHPDREGDLAHRKSL